MKGPLARLRRDHLPADLARELGPQGFQGSIAVQARQTVEESRWLLQLAKNNPRICGVVGWVDLQSPAVDEQLAQLSSDPKFVITSYSIHYTKLYEGERIG